MSHFMTHDVLLRNNPLPILMDWMEKEREKWEMQEITTQAAVKGASAMFGRVQEEEGEDEGKSGGGGREFKGECFGCGGTGHMRGYMDSYTFLCYFP